MKIRVPILAVTALLASCSQSDAPSDQMEQAAKDVVDVVEGNAQVAVDGPFAPRNECASLAAAPRFLDTLRRAISERDADALVALAADDIKLDFGDGSGTAELRSRLADPETDLWSKLAGLMELGCAANSQGGLTLPWYFEQSVPVQAVNGFIVQGVDVPLYNAPDSDAEVLARLSWDAVEAAPGGGEDTDFRRVRLPGEGGVLEPGTTEPQAGFVARDQLRSLLDYRLIAASRNGRWRIISLVRGD